MFKYSKDVQMLKDIKRTQRNLEYLASKSQEDIRIKIETFQTEILGLKNFVGE